MANNILTRENLGPEFDIGTIQSDRIRLKLSNQLSIALDGTISITNDRQYPVLSATPSTPDPGFFKQYKRTDGNLYCLNDQGVEERIWNAYTIIWAEESAAVANNATEWSYGNGDIGNIGIPLADDWEIYALGFNADVATAGSTISFDIVDFTTTSNMATDIATPNNFGANNNYVSVVDVPPIQVGRGVTLGFRTRAVTGTISSARVVAYLRR